MGRTRDGSVCRNCDFHKALQRNNLNLPAPQPLPKNSDPFWHGQSEDNLPLVFVGDDAFPLNTYCMKPYSNKSLSDEERIFNYRLSRFRRV